MWIPASGHIIINTQRRRDRNISNGKGSLTAATMQGPLIRIELETDNAVHAVSNQFRVFDVAHLGETRDFPNPKLNPSQLLFLKLSATRACGKRDLWTL